MKPIVIAILSLSTISVTTFAAAPPFGQAPIPQQQRSINGGEQTFITSSAITSSSDQAQILHSNETHFSNCRLYLAQPGRGNEVDCDIQYQSQKGTIAFTVGVDPSTEQIVGPIYVAYLSFH